MAELKVRNFGKMREKVAIPDLVVIQRKGYDEFLQRDVTPTKRARKGLEELFHETFPIESYDKGTILEYLFYELEQPRYNVNECRQLRLTYGYPLKITCRLRNKDGQDIAEQAIYLGEIPVMIGGGEFVINGAERVIVSQLHRSPGVDFLVESKEGDRILHGGRIIPERGSWIEISVTHKDVLVVKIDQSSKIPATIFLRALSADFSETEQIIRRFYETKEVSNKKVTPDMWAVRDIVDTESGEILVKAGAIIGDKAQMIQQGEMSTNMGVSEEAISQWMRENLECTYLPVELSSEEYERFLKKMQSLLRGRKGKDTIESLLNYVEDRLMVEWPDTNHPTKSEIPWFNREEPKDNSKVIKDAWDKDVPEELKKIFGACVTKSKGREWYVGSENVSEIPRCYIFRNSDKKVVYVGISDNLSRRLGFHWKGSCGNSSLRKHIRDEILSGKRKRSGVVEVVEGSCDALVFNTLAEDDCKNHKDALLRFYIRLRPGNPANQEKAEQFFNEKFFDVNRYRLGKVGRFRLNRKFAQNVSLTEMTLRAEDFINAVNYIIGLRNNKGEVDDIDHLGNRRLRTIDELAGGEIRKGLLKLRKTVQERMSTMKEGEQPLRIADLVNSKSVSSSINFFFGRGELSQIVDQTNALSQLTHERRLSALGPGGLNRRRAGFEVRDVHISHYGRICPVETPEGTNIGLISSLAIFATVDEYGFLLSPYYRVEKGKVTNNVVFLRADEEMKAIFAPPSAVEPETGKIREGMALARQRGELAQVSHEEVNYVDVSPKQIVGLSAALIPFLEHDDANRALMGSNMQRQAVPLLRCEPPLVQTGMEEMAGRYSSMAVRAQKAGTVTAVDATKVVINHTDEYKLEKYFGLNERTCLNQKPVVKLGQKVEKDQTLADGGGTSEGVLALGRNVLVGFMSYEGFNFEDAIIVSERLVKNDSFTSIHINEFDAEIRETPLGKEEFTGDIPNVSEKALRNLDEHGVVFEGTRVQPGDILVGKVVPKGKTELTPEEKLLHAIFGRAGEDVKNDSLELPNGYEGVVIKTERFVRRGAGGEEGKKALNAQIRELEKDVRAKQCVIFRQMAAAIHEKFEVDIIDPSSRQKVGVSEDDEVVYEQVTNWDIKWVKPAAMREKVEKLVDKFLEKIKALEEEGKKRVERLKHGDELPSGVIEMVKVYVATKRTMSIGDKIAGRHGNKGVIAKILPEEDMPFLEDGTSLDILLNPLGVPSRMNVGQILETHLGWVAKVLGFTAVTPVFDGAKEQDIEQLTEEANAVIHRRAEEIQNSESQPMLQGLINSYKSEEDKTVVRIGFDLWLNSFKVVYTDKLTADELEKLENAVIASFPDSLPRSPDTAHLPRFNEKPKSPSITAKDLEEVLGSEKLKPYYNAALAAITGTDGKPWLKAIPSSVKLVENRQGLYFFRNGVSGRVNEGYIGLAGKSNQMLRDRLELHFGGRSGNNFVERFTEEAEYQLKNYTLNKPMAADEIMACVPKSLKTQLYDGRTGEPFDQQATIGYIYIMKLHHLVDDKIHARSTGPYSLITQQPLGGKARTGGQRFGEMEVWALEGYGAAYTLQEMLTVKSDDVEGRTKIYESMVKGRNTLEAGTPLSFDVLCNEIRGLGLNIQLEKKRLGSTVL